MLPGVFLFKTRQKMRKGDAGLDILVFLAEQLSQAVEATFPERATIGDPALGQGEAFRFDPAGPDPPNLFGVHEAAFFEYLQVLNNGGQSDV
jgi:hypothetical protein